MNIYSSRVLGVSSIWQSPTNRYCQGVNPVCVIHPPPSMSSANPPSTVSRFSAIAGVSSIQAGTILRGNSDLARRRLLFPSISTPAETFPMRGLFARLHLKRSRKALPLCRIPITKRPLLRCALMLHFFRSAPTPHVFCSAMPRLLRSATMRYDLWPPTVWHDLHRNLTPMLPVPCSSTPMPRRQRSAPHWNKQATVQRVL